MVLFTTTLGSIEPLEARTNGGRVTVKFRAGTANGTAIITASSGGASASGANAARVAVGTAAVGSVRVSANPTLLPSVGGLSTITGSVIDINGNPLSSAPVTFSTTAGSLEQVAVSTDADGVATAVLRTRRPRPSRWLSARRRVRATVERRRPPQALQRLRRLRRQPGPLVEA